MFAYLAQPDLQPKSGGSTQESAPAGGAPASSGGSAQPPGSMITMLLPFLILVPFLFMSFRRQKKEQEQRKNLKKGDKVVMQGGLVGELVEMDERFAKVKIAPGTNVQVLVNAVSSLEAAPAPASKTDKELADLKEAKATADKK